MFYSTIFFEKKYLFFNLFFSSCFSKDIEAAEKIVENSKSKQTESISTNSVAPKVDESKEQTQSNEKTIENNDVKKENEKQKKLEFVLYGKRR